MKNQKGFAPIILLVLVIPVLIGVGAYLYLANSSKLNTKQVQDFQERQDVTPTSTPSATSTSFADDANVEINRDINPDPRRFDVQVEALEGDYARGEFIKKDDKPEPPIQAAGEGWIAMRTNSKWEIIGRGTGLPVCSDMNQFKVPKTIYRECRDYSQNNKISE